MTRANRRDFMDVHWLLVGEEKLWGLPALLLDRLKQTATKKAEYERQKMDMEREQKAAETPIDLDASKAAFLQRQAGLSAAPARLTLEEKQVGCAPTRPHTHNWCRCLFCHYPSRMRCRFWLALSHVHA
jgi:hypothetical protein